MIPIQETRSIKFYLDGSVSKKKKQEIINFLNECKDVENQLYEYYWNNIHIVVKSKSKIAFNYNNKLTNKDFKPQLKSHHFQQILQDLYGNMVSINSSIKKKIYIKMNNKIEQKIYNYCRGFCFDWSYLETYVCKQIKKYQTEDERYSEFLQLVQQYINNQEKYTTMKRKIEETFYLEKDKIKCPKIRNPCIWCSTFHTVELKQNSYYDWYFVLDSNEKISARRMKKITIPIKYSDYHYKVLEGKTLSNTFKIGLNKLNQIEIMATYNVEKEYINNKIDDIVGIDIGLKKLIVSSDGEVIDQNKEILKMLGKVVKNQNNRRRLEQHLRQKYSDDFRLSNNRYLRKQNRLTRFVISDNRYKIKQFLKSRPNDLIIMEDLEIGYPNTRSRKTNYLLCRLHIQSIKEDVLRYCKEYGINVQQVNPAFTSQLCPNCGYVDKKNRKTQETFKCIKCVHTDNADHNASINIRDRYFDERIIVKTPTWRIKEILEHDCNAHG